MGRKLIVNLDYGKAEFVASSTNTLTATVSKDQGKRRSGGGGGGGGGGRRRRSTAARQTLGTDNAGSFSKKPTKKMQPANATDDEEGEPMGRRQPVLTRLEQPAGVDVGMSGCGRLFIRKRLWQS